MKGTSKSGAHSLPLLPPSASEEGGLCTELPRAPFLEGGLHFAVSAVCAKPPPHLCSVASSVGKQEVATSREAGRGCLARLSALRLWSCQEAACLYAGPWGRGCWAETPPGVGGSRLTARQGLWGRSQFLCPRGSLSPCELEALLACGYSIQFCSWVINLGEEVKVLGVGTKVVSAGVWESLLRVC